MLSDSQISELPSSAQQRDIYLEKFQSYGKEALLQELIETKIELSLEIEESKRLIGIVDYLRKFFDEAQRNDLTVARNIARGVEKRSNPNKEVLHDCLHELHIRVKRDIEASDYTAFREIVFIRFPKPPKPKKPRLTALEQTYSPEHIQEELEIKAENGWAESSLRKFFEESTGLKIKKIKK